MSNLRQALQKRATTIRDQTFQQSLENSPVEPLPFHASETDFLTSIYNEFSPETRLCTVIRNGQFTTIPEHDLTEAERRAAYLHTFMPCGGD